MTLEITSVVLTPIHVPPVSSPSSVMGSLVASVLPDLPEQGEARDVCEPLPFHLDVLLPLQQVPSQPLCSSSTLSMAPLHFLLPRQSLIPCSSFASHPSPTGPSGSSFHAPCSVSLSWGTWVNSKPHTVLLTLFIPLELCHCSVQKPYHPPLSLMASVKPTLSTPNFGHF